MVVLSNFILKKAAHQYGQLFLVCPTASLAVVSETTTVYDNLQVGYGGFVVGWAIGNQK